MKLLNSTSGALVVLLNSIAAKCFMSLFYRLRQLLSGSGKKAVEIEMQPDYKWTHRTQLNEAEWAPLSCSVLFFLSVKGVPAEMGSTVLAVSSVVYFWGRWLTGPKMNFLGPIAATARYIGVLMLAAEIYGLM